MKDDERMNAWTLGSWLLAPTLSISENIQICPQVTLHGNFDKFLLILERNNQYPTKGRNRLRATLYKIHVLSSLPDIFPASFRSILFTRP